MGNFTVAFAVFMLCALTISEAAVYIGGGCYDCNPPGGQAPGVYTGLGGGGGGGGGRGQGGGGNYYNRGGGNGGGRPVYSGNFGPNGYSGGGGGRGGGAYGGGGGADYDTGLTQIIRG